MAEREEERVFTATRIFGFSLNFPRGMGISPVSWGPDMGETPMLRFNWGTT
ncbi:MAG TPA: hypothetical protein VG722_09370 [Tepidisphaeraceae bacterium]|nr:hypothetical protein [Tepidisphaeraceae bacterium]